MTEPVAVGVVGAGSRGHSHAEAFDALSDVEVRAVADVDETAARNLAEEYDAAVYHDHAEMVADEALDSVSVCVHNNLHAPIAVDALESGAHVFCEKPMAGSYADARRMAETADAVGKHLGVQNAQLFTRETFAAKRLVETEALGDLSYARAIRSRRRGRPYVDGYGTPAFVDSATAGGGPVYDIGTYAIGRMLYLLGGRDVERFETGGKNLLDFGSHLKRWGSDLRPTACTRTPDGSLTPSADVWNRLTRGSSARSSRSPRAHPTEPAGAVSASARIPTAPVPLGLPASRSIRL